MKSCGRLVVFFQRSSAAAEGKLTLPAVYVPLTTTSQFLFRSDGRTFQPEQKPARMSPLYSALLTQFRH